MSITETYFDTNRLHIHIELIVVNNQGIEYSVDAILDTGAPRTELSDHFLLFTGFINSIDDSVIIKTGLHTQKYNKALLPEVKIYGHTIHEFEVFVSHFEESWGIDALIGLDFFRQFLVTVDYSKGVIITKPLK